MKKRNGNGDDRYIASNRLVAYPGSWVHRYCSGKYPSHKRAFHDIFKGWWPDVKRATHEQSSVRVDAAAPMCFQIVSYVTKALVRHTYLNLRHSICCKHRPTDQRTLENANILTVLLISLLKDSTGTVKYLRNWYKAA